METKTILIKSKNSKIEYNLNTYMKNIREMKILGICLPNTNYLITNNNNIFEFYLTGKYYTVKITKMDVYSIDSFLQYLENELNKLTAITFTILYDEDTNKIKIDVNADVKLKFSKGMAKLLGFEEGETELGKKFESKNVINFNKCLYYNIIFENFNENVYYYNDVDLGCVLINETVKIIKPKNKISLNTLNIRLMDDNDKYVDFNGIDWSMILEFTYEN